MSDSTITNPIFNTVDDLREYLKSHELEDTVYFENPSFVKAITGITDSGQLIYDYDLMIAAAMEEQEWSEEDAIDWIDYNTLQYIPNMGFHHPIVRYHINW